MLRQCCPSQQDRSVQGTFSGIGGINMKETIEQFFARNTRVLEPARSTGRGYPALSELGKFVILAAIIMNLDYPLLYIGVMLIPDFFSIANNIVLFTLYERVIVLLFILLFCRIFEKRGPETLGFNKIHPFRSYIYGLLIGLFMFFVVVMPGVALGAFSFVGISHNMDLLLILGMMIGYLIQSMQEQVLCRGFFLVSLARKNSVVTAVVISSLAFTAMHYLNEGLTPISVLNLLLFGFFYALYFLKDGNIYGVAAIQGIWNFAEGNLFGFKVSGLPNNPSFYEFRQNGKPLLDGGAFGPEGGLIVTVVLIIAICLIFVYDHRLAKLGKIDDDRSWKLERKVKKPKEGAIVSA